MAEWPELSWMVAKWMGGSIPPTHHKGSFAKGGKPTLAGGDLKTDPGGKAYEDSECDLKTNGEKLRKTCLYYSNTLIMAIGKPKLRGGQ